MVIGHKVDIDTGIPDLVGVKNGLSRRQRKAAAKNAKRRDPNEVRGDEILLYNTGVDGELCLVISNRGTGLIQKGRAFDLELVNGEKKMKIKIIGEIVMRAMQAKEAAAIAAEKDIAKEKESKGVELPGKEGVPNEN